MNTSNVMIGVLMTMIRRNRCYGEWLGWNEYKGEISRTVLGLAGGEPEDLPFVEAVQGWQERHGLNADGVIGTKTLTRMHEEHPELDGVRLDLGFGLQPWIEPEHPRWIDWHKSPNHESRQGTTIDTIVYHATMSSNLGSAINTFTSSSAGTSAHFVVDRDGRIVQMVPLDRAAQHAGLSNNRRSIGIEIVNVGQKQHSDAARRMCKKSKLVGNMWKCVEAEDVNQHRALESYYRFKDSLKRDEYWIPYTADQYDSLLRLTRYLVSCIPTIKYITGHEHLVKWRPMTTDKGRTWWKKERSDPGGLFDWQRITIGLDGWFFGTICHEVGKFEKDGTVNDIWREKCPDL